MCWKLYLVDGFGCVQNKRGQGKPHEHSICKLPSSTFTKTWTREEELVASSYKHYSLPAGNGFWARQTHPKSR